MNKTIFLISCMILGCSSYPVRVTPDSGNWIMCKSCKGSGYIDNYEIKDNGRSYTSDTKDDIHDFKEATSDYKRDKTKTNENVTDKISLDEYDYTIRDKNKQTCINCFGCGWIYSDDIQIVNEQTVWSGDGFARMTLSNGNVYEGRFRNYTPFGYGKMIYSNGYIYYGQFRGFMKNGEGLLFMQKYSGFQGIWRNDKLITR
jgi:hypothetical protein